jgi:hypothetical protein
MRYQTSTTCLENIKNIRFLKLGGALAGKQKMVYGLGPNPVAGENCLHFSMFGHFSKFSEL